MSVIVYENWEACVKVIKLLFQWKNAYKRVCLFLKNKLNTCTV